MHPALCRGGGSAVIRPCAGVRYVQHSLHHRRDRGHHCRPQAPRPVLASFSPTAVSCCGAREGERPGSTSIIWTIVVVLLVLWLLGCFVARVGDVVHLLLVLAMLVVIYNVTTDCGQGSAV